MPRRKSKGKRGGVSSPRPGRLMTVGGGFPDSIRTKLRFAVSSNVASVGTLQVYLVTINNLFDPSVSLGTLQPVYFDQLAMIYNRYRVYGSEIKVTAVYQQSVSGIGTVQEAARLVVAPINGALSPTTIDDAMAQNFAKFTEVTSTRPGILHHKITCAKLTGTHDVVGSDRFQAIVSAAPSEVLNWSVAALNAVAQTNVDFHVQFQLVYDVEFFDRINLDRSALSYQLMRKAVLARFAESREAEAKRLKGTELPPLAAFERQAVKLDAKQVGEHKTESPDDEELLEVIRVKPSQLALAATPVGTTGRLASQSLAALEKAKR